MDAASHASASALKQLRELATQRASAWVDRECWNGKIGEEKTERSDRKQRHQVNISLQEDRNDGLTKLADELGTTRATLAKGIVTDWLARHENGESVMAASNTEEIGRMREDIEELRYILQASMVRILAAVGVKDCAIREFIKTYFEDVTSD